MKKILPFCFLLLLQSLGVKCLQGQTTAMTVTPVANIDRLVREVFIREGDCTQVSNIELIGRQIGVGSFTVEEGVPSIGIGAGLILSSGAVVDAVGPNEKNNTTSSATLSNSDRDLRRLSGQAVFDATGIAFDFVPTSSKVSFNYVFASEEYCEFVNQEFNDVFGFFVSGPGLNGNFDRDAINVALLPTTRERVAINSVNHLRNTQFFIPNFLEKDIQDCGLPPRMSPLRDVEFDGFTVRLRATIDVIPCSTYHIRLVVGDVADDILDSAVFLEANSFELGEKVDIRAELSTGEGNTLYENCLEGNFIFERRALADQTQPLVVNYEIEGTAQNGIDYEAIPEQVIIPAGERLVYLPIKPIADQLPEDTEQIRIITAFPSCICIERDTAELLISDEKKEVAITFDEESACPDQAFRLQPARNDGVPPLVYLWSTGDTTQQIEVRITEPANYTLTITDACGAVGVDTVRVDIQALPQASLSGVVEWCPGARDISLPVRMEGSPPWSLSYQDGFGSLTELEGITADLFALPVEGTGTYELLRFRDKNCVGTVTGTGQVNSRSFTADYTILAPSCRTASDGEIQLQVRGGVAPYAVSWGRSVPDPFRLTSVGIGTYEAVIRDAGGCVEMLAATIEASSVPESCFLPKESIYIPNAFSPNGDQVNDLFQVYPQSGSFASIRFEVYDRWGSLQYRSASFLSARSGIGWDGGEAAVGVYLCKVTVLLTDGRVEQIAQSFQLMR